MIRNLRDFEAVHFLSNPKNVENIVDHDPRIKPDRLFLPFLNERDGLGRLIRHKNSLSKDLIRIESLPTEREKGERLETKNVGSHTYRDSISPRIYNQSEHPNLIQHTPVTYNTLA